MYVVCTLINVSMYVCISLKLFVLAQVFCFKNCGSLNYIQFQFNTPFCCTTTIAYNCINWKYVGRLKSPAHCEANGSRVGRIFSVSCSKIKSNSKANSYYERNNNNNIDRTTKTQTIPCHTSINASDRFMFSLTEIQSNTHICIYTHTHTPMLILARTVPQSICDSHFVWFLRWPFSHMHLHCNFNRRA